MVRDSVQLETAVNTISHEYPLEFTSEYDIPEMLLPELPGLGDRIVDFPEGKVDVYTKFFEFANFRLPLSQFLFDVLGKRPRKNTPQCYTKPLDSLKNWNNRFFWVDERIFQTVVDWRTNASKDGMPVNEMDIFSLICALNPTKVKTGSRPRAPHEVSLLTLTASRVIEMDKPTVATDSSGVPSAIEMSLLDFAHEDGAFDQGTAAPKMPPPEDVPATAAPGVGQAEEAIATEPPCLLKVLLPPRTQSLRMFLPLLKLGLQEVYTGRNRVSPMVAYSTPLRPARTWWTMLLLQVAMGSQLRLRFEEEAKLLRKFVAQVARRDKRIKAQELEIKKLETLLETEADMKRAAKDKSAGLIKELEDMRAWFSDLQVSHGQLSQQVVSLKEQVSGEEKLKAAFEEFKRYEDERVERWCAELDACLDALSIDFDEELYPHMLTAIAGHRWVVGHGLCLAMMKCAESLKMRQAFADVMSAGVAKGMCEGLKHRVEHGQAQLTVESIEAYDPEAEAKFFAALQSLKDLKSDGVLVSVPTVVPQSLALLLVDAATQTDLEDA
nr:transposase (putative), gypsy type [Tanacetum cinerariifolium]